MDDSDRCQNCGVYIEDEPGVKFTITPRTPDGETLTEHAETLIWCDEKECMLAAIEEIGKTGIFDPPKDGEWDEVEVVLDDDTVIKLTDQPDAGFQKQAGQFMDANDELLRKLKD